jgi:hypothetical protein
VDTEPEARTINLLCRKKKGDFYTVSIGPGWFPARMRPLFDKHFESAPLLLDFDHLDYVVEKQGARCDIRESKHGDKELSATGESALLLANWLGGAMSSGLVPR